MERRILESSGTEETSEVGVATRCIARGRCTRGRYQRRLAKARERLALLASTKGLGFWSWNRATDVAWASKHARSVLGLGARGSLTRDTLLAAIHPVDRIAMLRAISRTARQTDTVEME